LPPELYGRFVSDETSGTNKIAAEAQGAALNPSRNAPSGGDC